MNSYRVGLVSQAFRKLDKNGDGKVTPEDLVGVFNVKKHPKYLNGDWSEKQIIQSFLETFQIGDHRDATVSERLQPPSCFLLFDKRSHFFAQQVTYDEFLLYYSGVSASIDSDAYFDVMMRNSWKI